MTEPLTPADCDLRDFAFMPLDVVRLRDSDLAIHVNGEEFRAAVLLWCAAWHQIPAASLPDDDKTLASLAGYGRVVAEWQKVREGALRGWMKCSDGRLYHPVVAEKAREAWRGKHQHAYGKLGDRVRKANKARQAQGLPAWLIPSFDDWLSAGMPGERELFPPEGSTNSGGNSQDSAGNNQDSGGKEPDSGRKFDGIPTENPLKGQGEGQGYKDKERDSASAQDEGQGDYLPSGTAYGLMAKLLRSRGVEVAAGNPHMRAWVDKGLTEDEALAGIEAARLAKPAPEAIPWAYLSKTLETLRTKASAVPEKAAQAAKPTQTDDRWWLNNAGIDRKGRELGLFARGGESYLDFKDRIFEALRRRDAAAQEQTA
ncbi:DUF1376 domain-containing protein [Bordetella avium]|uniref:DUF1376 domain-containing protein n=1 Tax=Bordetella avium TaxID=521 RepID=UPI000FDC7AB4|nr:DUF1376 domain-containing protein [Bordetella avium]AZY49605.1 DUF1376 domain-containing protein [Bordetella avium]